MRHRTLGLIAASIAAITASAIVGLGSQPAVAHTAPATALAYFNLYRATAGVQTVTENASYSAGDHAHAEWMVLNNSLMHGETPGTPGYSAAGDLAGQRGNLSGSCGVPGTNIRTYRDAIDGLMAAPFHALNMVHPAMGISGFGDHGDTSRQCPNFNYAAAIDVLSHRAANGGVDPAGTTYPKPWPANNSTVPLTRFSGNESPDPVAFCPGWSQTSGLPILLQTNAGTPNVSAFSITDTSNNTALEVCEIDQTKATGIAQSIMASRNSIILFPRFALVAGRTYTASVTNHGVPFSWSFTIGTPGTDPSIQTATLSVSPTSVAPGGNVTATWAQIPSSTGKDWIGLFPSAATPHANFISWQYINGNAAGNASFPIPVGAGAGASYELRLFSNDTTNLLARSGPFTVTGTLTANPTTVAAGSSTTATWSTIATPTAQDWIGLYPNAGAADNAFSAWTYTTGAPSGSVPFPVPAETPAGATYQLRLFANNGLSRLATSSPLTVTPAPATTLSASPTTVVAGATTTATWTNMPSPTGTDWIALYPTAGTPDTSFVAWRYTNGQASSNVPFPIPASATPGPTYQLRIFSNNTYTRRAVFGPLTVNAAPTPTLSANPTTVARGNTTTVTWSGIASPSATDWIALYPSGATDDTAFVAWTYTTGAASGNRTLTVPSNAAPGTQYELRLFANNGYTRLSAFAPLRVTGPATLSANPTTVARGNTTTVTWSGIPAPSAADWIALYPSGATDDTAFVAWTYTTGAASGNRTLTVPSNAAPGTQYELRLFANNGYTRLAAFGPLTVTGAATLAANPTTVSRNGATTVTWSGIASPSAADWIALYPSGATDDTAFVAWKYTTGAANGNTSFPIPINAPLGTTYELRLFSNNGYTRLAAFGPMTVAT